MKQSFSHSVLRRFVVGGLVATGVIATIAVTYTVIPLPASTPVPGVATPTGGASDGRSSASPGETEPGSESAPAPAPFVPAPTPVGPRTTTEVEASGGGDPGQPAPKPLSPLLPGDTPADASALKKIVAGFPEIIPLAERSTVVASSVSSSDGRVQATLEATTTKSPAEITEYYRTVFATLSLAGTSTPSADGSSGTVFSRGGDSVTLTVAPHGDGTRYSLFGAITVAG